jgi:cytochrome c1
MKVICALLIASLPVAFAAIDDTAAARHEKARELFVDACTACHTLDRVRVQHLNGDEWRHLIAGMLSEGVPLTDEETSLLVNYLAQYFGPEKQ